MGTSPAKRWPEAERIFRALSLTFGAIFTIEILTKALGLRTRFVHDPWNWIDTGIVIFWLIGEVEVVPVNPFLFRVARLVRLLRLLRLVRSIQGFDALYLMTTALKGSLSILTWSCALLIVIHMMLALCVSQILIDMYLLDESVDVEKRREVYEYFGTFSRSMLSMFELTLANWIPPTRLLGENVSEIFTLLCLAHKLVVGFAVIGVINGVFMQETFKVASCDDRIMVKQSREP